LHGTDITLVGSNASFRPVTKMTIEDADAVTVVSQFLKEETIRQFDVQRELAVIYNFIDPERHELEPSPCIPQCTDSSQKTIMHISNFRPVKRIRDVIEIFARISETVDIRLILVGDGPDSPVAREMGQELGVLDRMKFVGIVDRVASLLARADLFLLPSSTESFGLVALEAMASGVPVIASDVGGIPEVIEHGRTGYLAPVGDVDAMSTYAIDLLQNEARHRQFGTEAQEQARQRFDYRLIVPQYEQLYENTLQN
ncbi:N-acetyl-alpha-D-glucosaminyl L-malate synthase BshA, partial [Candidatus Bipolaricaulota bacterium]|nr:N-acetyl-alpha-D-glucosaminyl L-malate synthase BshA [Candidatus Bipolaricaulota bacterium]